MHARSTQMPLVLLLAIGLLAVGLLAGAEPLAAQVDPELQRLPSIDEPAAPAESTEESSTLDEPLDPELIDREWIWYQPASWYRWEVWEGSFELGINGGAGNTDTLSLKTGADLNRETRIVDLDLDATYARTTADAKTTQDIAIFNSSADWKLGDSPWSVFNKANVTIDQLRAFDMRLVLNAGVGYKLIDTKAARLAARFGSGTSKEFGGPNERWVPEAVFGSDFVYRIGKRHKFTATLDFFPDWEDYNEYRITAKASWQIMLDQANRLSLKLEATDRYDSTPDGLRPNEINYAMLLIWKL